MKNHFYCLKSSYSDDISLPVLIKKDGKNWYWLDDAGRWTEVSARVFSEAYEEIGEEEARRLTIDRTVFSMVNMVGDQEAMARTLAALAFRDVVDKGGKPYYYHLCHVAEGVSKVDEKAVAWLHDIVEDTVVSLLHLGAMGFAVNIIKAVDAITKRDNQSYEDYISKVAADPLARAVKISDLKHNMDLSRIPDPGPQDFMRVEKYKTMLERLLTAS